MSREVWGTFSVRDHLVAHAFVADVLLYDRLLVPTKPADKSPDEWPKEWGLERLNRVMGILGDLALPVPWTDYRRNEWQKYYDAGKAERAKLRSGIVGDANTDIQYVHEHEYLERLHATRMLLADYANEKADDQLFKRLLATAKARPGSKLEAVAAYTSFDAFRAEVPVEAKRGKKGSQTKKADEKPIVPPTAIFGWDFFIPDSDDRSEAADMRLLERAVKLASKPEFIAARGRLYDWVGDASDALSKGVLTPADARRDMEGRIAEYKEFMKQQEWKRWARRAIKVADAFAGNLGVVKEVAGKIAEGFFGVADVVGDAVLDDAKAPERIKVAAVFHEAHRQFGWKPLAHA